MRIKGLCSTKEKPPDIYLEYKIKTNVVFVQMWTLAQQTKENLTQTNADASPPHQAE